MLSYSKKNLQFIITLAEGTFQSTGTNSITLYGYRASATVEKAGGAMFSVAECKIFGVPQGDMNDATTLIWGAGNKLIRNTVVIYAIDESNSYTSLVFEGDIIQAWGFYDDMPQVYLYIQAQGSFYNNQLAYPVTTYNGSIDVATAIGKIAKDLGYTFENNGVHQSINNLYQSNSGIQQIKNIAIAAGINIYFDNNVIAITPPGVPREGLTIILSQSSGMIGYPTFDGIGVDIRILYNPLLVFGGKIQVESSIPRANGIFTVTCLTHYLESQTPDGQWFTLVRGSHNGFAINN